MEQQLINALMKLLAKAGGGFLVKELIQKVDTNGNPKQWTYSELTEAVTHVTKQIEHFGPDEVAKIIETLQRKYPDASTTTTTDRETLHTTPGVKGLD
jgi:hypothetical protein